jgi:hypothetical protein
MNSCTSAFIPIVSKTIRLRTPLLICLAVFAGCGGGEQVLPDRATISGTVTFDGKPLVAGTIGFEAADGPVATAASISNGAYSTNRAPIGKTLVTVDTYSIQVVDPAAYVPIPERYTNSKTSGLSAEVQPGENRNVDFVLNQ